MISNRWALLLSAPADSCQGLSARSSEAETLFQQICNLLKTFAFWRWQAATSQPIEGFGSFYSGEDGWKFMGKGEA
ncbi:hypothetical protein [Pseudomonas guariconensis]|uniref:hypothetical protein n=1 Tax=Pseudomonas guariconensis TaxID=1288410 RepID=UPI0036F2406E